MMKPTLMLSTVAFVSAVLLAATAYSQDQNRSKLAAPMFYIAATGEWNASTPNEVRLKGTSNLPAGARLFAVVSDFIGYKSTILSEDAVFVVGKDGRFEATLKAKPGKQFRHDMVCDVSFDPHHVRQSDAVLKVTGRWGQLLGGESNPQVGKMSGENFYLFVDVHIP